MHGYVARLGLGITLIRNQIVEIVPESIIKRCGGI
jgi:hypothetical protein